MDVVKSVPSSLDSITATCITEYIDRKGALTLRTTANGYALRAMKRLMAKVDIQPDGCWRWIGQIRKRDGYGRMSLARKSITAYRASYLLFRGDIPSGLEIDHLCRNHACVNPDHLEAVTHVENLRRSPIVGRHGGKRTHCKNGHSFETAQRGARGERICKCCKTEWYEQNKARIIEKHRQWRIQRRAKGLPVT
jgi:hypothetical protein